MLHVHTSITIAATASEVRSAYLQYDNWPQIFPETIIAVKLLKADQRQTEIEVLHRRAGKVLNIVTPVSNNEIRLEEFKPMYHAVFVNTFIPADHGCCYRIEGHIELKGLYRIFQPFIRKMVKDRMTRSVLLPVKEYTEHLP